MRERENEGHGVTRAGAKRLPRAATTTTVGEEKKTKRTHEK